MGIKYTTIDPTFSFQAAHTYISTTWQITWYYPDRS